MAEDDLINLRQDVERHENAVTEDANEIALLKDEMKELKDGIRELIDALEDLATAKEQVAITTGEAERALKRFGRRITGLKQHFETEEGI